MTALETQPRPVIEKKLSTSKRGGNVFYKSPHGGVIISEISLMKSDFTGGLPFKWGETYSVEASHIPGQNVF